MAGGCIAQTVRHVFRRRRVRTLLATGRYLLTIDYRKKDINNEK